MKIVPKEVPWSELHDWIMLVRNINNLSISSFLCSCDLDPTKVSHRHLASTDGISIVPSSKRGTPGQHFREKIIDARSLTRFFAKRSDRDGDFALCISDWRLDHASFLRKNLICDLSARTSGTKLVLNVHRDVESRLNNEALVEAVWQCHVVSANFHRAHVNCRSLSSRQAEKENAERAERLQIIEREAQRANSEAAAKATASAKAVASANAASAKVASAKVASAKVTNANTTVECRACCEFRPFLLFFRRKRNQK